MINLKRYLNQDVFISVFLLIIAILFYILTFDLPNEASMFPVILVIMLSLFSIFIILTGIKRNEFESHGDDESKLTVSLLKSPLFTFLGIFLYSFFITIIGFFPSTIIFIVLYLYINNFRSIKAITITVIAIVAFVYLLFVYQLNVNLPIGILFE